MFHKWMTGALAGLALFGMLGSANAALIDSGLTTIDDDAGLEWLDLTETLNQSYDDIIGGFGGLILDGWHVATTLEVCSLFRSLGDAALNCGDGSFQSNDAILSTNAETLVELLGDNLGGAICGIIDGGGAAGGTQGLAGVHHTSTGCFGGATNEAIARPLWTTSSFSLSSLGTFMVKSATVINVPEPSSLLLFGVGLTGLAFMRRRKRKNEGHRYS